jgi:tRNA-dihydrouridine synthase B
MAGVTDVPFRQVAWTCGVGYQMGEMVSDNPRLWNSKKSRLRRMPLYGCGPQVIQIAGSEPEQVAQAAVLQWQTGADVLDINFGCPAKKVCRKAAGSALLANPQLVQDIAAAVVAAVPIPVTAKIRTGPAPGQQNALQIGLLLQDAGISALAVHGRTRACKFNGVAELDTVAAVKQSLSIPVFANGDITSPAAAVQALAHTKADGVMVGRGALGAPWVLGQMAAAIQGNTEIIAGTIAETTVSIPATPELADILRLMAGHLVHLHNFYGLEQGVRFARKHMGWYFEQQGLLSAKRLFNRLPCANSQLDALSLLQALNNQHEAAALPDVFAAALTASKLEVA